jgi:hypothetical protein
VTIFGNSLVARGERIQKPLVNGGVSLNGAASLCDRQDAERASFQSMEKFAPSKSRIGHLDRKRAPIVIAVPQIDAREERSAPY